MDYDGRVYALASLIVPALWGVAAAQSADVSPWYTLPITNGLHPVRIQPGLAWQRSMATVMAGDGASPYYRDTATAMDVRWRLEMEGRPQIPLSEDEATAALNLSLTGAAMGLTRMVHDALARDEVLGVAQDVVRLALSPGVVVQREARGFHVELDDRARGFQQGSAAVLEGPRSSNRGPPQGTMRFGTGLRLADGGADLTDDLLGDPVPAASAWLGLDHMGLDALLLDVSWADPWGQGPHARELSWGLAARQALWNGVSARAEITSDDGVGLPDRSRTGLNYRLKEHRAWNVRLDLVRRFPSHTDEAFEGEWRVELGLRANLDWVLPVDIDRWPLGQQVGAPGPTLPTVRRAGPNELTELLIQPAHR